MAITKAEKLRKIHEEALHEFNQIQSVLREERLMCLQDRRFAFLAGAQWEGPLSEQFENKPRPEMNKVALSITRIYSEYRNNRIDVEFISKEGDEYDKLADTCAGLYRSDEQDSQAEEAYDNAFEEAVAGGFGAWRLRAEYEDDEDMENEQQRIRMEPIFDADSCVFFDLNAKRQDKSDAKRCYVVTPYTPEAFEEEFGRDTKMASLPKAITNSYFDWFSPNVIYVAEFYKVEEKKDIVHVYEDPTGAEERYLESELDDELLANIEARGLKEVMTRKIKKKKVHKYIMDGNGIIEDHGLIAGSCIPIIPVYGKRFYVDNVERCMGHTRTVKDAQRVKNMQLGKLMEISAKSSYRKPIFTPEQITGHEYTWAEDNIKNYPYKLVNPIMDDATGQKIAGGPVAYDEPPEVPASLAALIQLSDADMNDILGNQQAGEQIVSAMSGKAVELVQNRLDMQSFIYISNMAKAIKRSGEVWLSMARDVFVEDGRKMKVMGDQDEIDFVEINRPVMGEEGLEHENDLSKAKFDIAVDVGPSSSSKRASTVRALTGMMAITADPETVKVLGAAAMMNMEGEGLGDIRQYYRMQLIRMGVVKPTQQEQEQLMQEMQAQASKPDPQAQYLAAASQNEQAKALKAQADTALTAAKTEETKMSIIEKMAGLDQKQQAHLMDMIERASNMNQTTESEPMP